MHKTVWRGQVGLAGTLALAASLSALSGAVPADEHRRGSHDREHYQDRHWAYDNRHGHAHYYPSRGSSMLALPVGFLALTYASRHLFYHAGVWYEPGPAGYVVIRPPIGVPVSALPPDYSTVWAGNRPYYYANETYYQRAANGYVVVNPPATGTYVEAPQAAPPVPMLPPVPKPAAGTWYFCHSSNTYYPYVPTCPEGFQAVPAAPTPGR